MRNINIVRPGDEVQVNGVTYVALRADQRDSCNGCVARIHSLCHDLPPCSGVVFKERESLAAVAEAPSTAPPTPAVDQHAPGTKLDQGKVRPGLVLGGFSRALTEVSRVGTFGANKYTDNGWQHVPDGISRYTDAMHRHLLAEAAGEQRDPESELLHAAHAAWNALARLDLMLRDKEKPE